MAELVQPPALDERNESLLSAQAIARVTGPLTVEDVERRIETLRSLLPLLASGLLTASLCPELTNANPSSAHVVFLEAEAFLAALLSRKINVLPEKVAVEFARFFQVELRDATAATAALTFTVAGLSGTHVLIPEGIEVSTPDGAYTFTTDEDLEIVLPVTQGTVAATCTVAGEVVLAPNVLTRLDDGGSFISAVTNSNAVSSGSDAETLASALARARTLQRRAQRLVSAADIEDAILNEVMNGNGVVKAFSFVPDGDFTKRTPGHTTVVVMTKSADPVSAETKAAIMLLLDQVVGSQFIYLKDPEFVDFDVAADVLFDSTVSLTAARAAVERNLRDYFSADPANFGRRVTRTKIIAIIEDTPGVTRIVPSGDDELISPAEDIVVAPYQLPRVGDVTINPAS